MRGKNPTMKPGPEPALEAITTERITSWRAVSLLCGAEGEEVVVGGRGNWRSQDQVEVCI